jgi:hypothetical protein
MARLNIFAIMRLAVIGSFFVGLYLSQERGYFWLVSAVSWLAGLCGALVFISLCACLFVNEATRQRRIGLMMFGLGGFGVWISIAEWLRSDEAIACESLTRWRFVFCAALENTPAVLQSPVAYLGFLLVLLVSSWLAYLGWRVYRDER